MADVLDDVRPRGLEQFRDLLLAQPDRVGVQSNIEGRRTVATLVEKDLSRRLRLDDAGCSLLLQDLILHGIARHVRMVRLGVVRVNAEE